MDTLPEPLGGPAPAEVPLSDAPLAVVLAQVRFPEQAVIRTMEGVARFQQEVKHTYPDFRPEVAQSVQLDITTGAQTLTRLPLLRFGDLEGDWRVTLAVDALTLETRKYTNRDDFLSRFSVVLNAVQSCYDPQLVVRTGVRYIDRIDSESALSQLVGLIRPEIAGIATSSIGAYTQHVISEATLPVDEGTMLLRWGLLPPNATFDPNLLPPQPERSWVLDIDVSSESRKQFSARELDDTFSTLTRRAYAVFRYAVTDNFLRRFGGKI